MFSYCVYDIVIITCVALQWTDHSNGQRFLCFEVHRDCSSGQQCSTVWRHKAIWSEGLCHYQSYCVINKCEIEECGTHWIYAKIGVNLLNKIAIFLHFCIIWCSIAVLNEVYDLCQMHNKMLTVVWESHQVHCTWAFLVLMM